jgi:hypothetical protein
MFRIAIRPGERGNLEISIRELAIKLRALRVLVEVDGSLVEVTPAGGAVRLRTPSGEHYLRSVEVGVADFFSIEDRGREVVIRRALYVY